MMPTSVWSPTCSVDAIKLRARCLSHIRQFFAQRAVLEVDTPIMSKAGATDLYLESLSVNADGELLYLQTSPEFAMKRLLAAGSGSIFQICKAFRAGERGRKHNPEFSMLEWYRLDFDLEDLMLECEALINHVGITTPATRISYRQAFIEFAGIDPFDASLAQLRVDAAACSGLNLSDESRDDCLDILLSHLVEPNLGRTGPQFMLDYPASQAALAKIFERDGVQLAKRFELYINGLELANGYHELTDAAEQTTRFSQDNVDRVNAGIKTMPIDHNLTAALEAGMPECAGVALGVDRLLMVLAQANCIDEVLSFPIERA